MQANVITLYKSANYEINNFLCQCTDCALSMPEYQDKFSFCFIRKGNFLFKVFRNDLDSYTGKILLNKPGYEYQVAHIHSIPDECTIFTLSQEFYEQLADIYKTSLNGFLINQDIQSLLVESTISIDYLHYRILGLLSKKNISCLQIDSLLMDLIDKAFSINPSKAEVKNISDKYKKNYLNKIEIAKDYIQSNFESNITLQEIALSCSLSQFHFARIFKSIAGISPYQYLLNFRLKHSENLLKTTTLPVTDISALSGFNNPAHFTFAFTEKNDLAPSAYRTKQV
jgi:AraC-like DNA-binding protein